MDHVTERLVSAVNRMAVNVADQTTVIGYDLRRLADGRPRRELFAAAIIQTGLPASFAMTDKPLSAAALARWAARVWQLADALHYGDPQLNTSSPPPSQATPAPTPESDPTDPRWDERIDLSDPDGGTGQ